MLVFNGEIYNYLELKAELKDSWTRFATTSDTEVIIAAYRQWGFDCQKKFNGMWAFALWDCSKAALPLARPDRREAPSLLGPGRNFHLRLRDQEPACLQSQITSRPRVPATVYLSLGYVPAPYTFYSRNISIAARHYLVVRDGHVQLASTGISQKPPRRTCAATSIISTQSSRTLP